VRVYHGRHKLPKAYVARMRLSVPATSDYWVNDMTGDLLFVVTAEANAGMVKMLPLVLEEVRTVVGERRPPNTGPHLASRSARGSSRLSHVRALAAGKLLLP
jgi:hypothetical protein